jgi:beta-glucosidase/6-phospho-beta-glucosidase/beta-galactosidase
MACAGLGTSASEFLWAVGIENTFVPHTRAGHRRLDEYELMDHYRLWRQDIDLAAGLGVSGIRYGIPWYRVNPRPGVFDWSWTDPVLEYLVSDKGLTPVVDLMHYGTPLWLDNHFVNASYPRRVAEYASAFAERYRSLVRFYTPLNEPGVTAAYCGRDGRWPPYLSGDDGYVKVLLALAKGMAQTAEALRAARPDAVLVHVEDVGLERAAREELADHAARAQARRLLPLDLACGRVVDGHPWLPWLREHGATEHELHDLAARAPRWDVLGVNYYPWSNRRLTRRRDGSVKASPDPASAALAPVLRLVHERYGLPLVVTETSSPGGHLDRLRWMTDTLDAVRSARGAGIPVLGYTWFPMFTMIEWKYRWSRKGLEDHLLHLGLWDVTPRGGRLDRDATPLVEAYRRFIAATLATIGEPPPASFERVA